MEHKKLAIIYNGKKYSFNWRTLVNSGLYHLNHVQGQDFTWSGDYSHECFESFRIFVENMEDNMALLNPHIIKLVEEWSFENIQEKIIKKVESWYDRDIYYKEKQNQFKNEIRVNSKRLSEISNFFANKLKSDGEYKSEDRGIVTGFPVIEFDNVDQAVFKTFLDCVHCIRSLPEDSSSYDIYSLCKHCECDCILPYINKKSKEFILKPLLENWNRIDDISDRKESYCDFEELEKLASDVIHELVNEQRFYLLSIPRILRIVHRSSLCDNLDSILLFIRNIMEKHNDYGFILIQTLDLSKFQQDIDRILDAIIVNYNMGSLFGLIKQYNNRKRYDESLVEIQHLKKIILDQRTQCETEKKQIINDYEGILLDEWKTKKPESFVDNIFLAALNGNLSSVIFLVSNGCDINSKCPKDIQDEWSVPNATPLHFASLNGHLSVVDYLSKNGADINAQTDESSVNIFQ